MTLLEFVMIAVQHGRNRGDFFGKQRQVQLGIALLNHTPQEPGGVDAPFGSVNGAAVPTHFADMTGLAFVLRDQLRAQRQVGIFEFDRALRMSAGRTKRRRQCDGQEKRNPDGKGGHRAKATRITIRLQYEGSM